MKIFIQSLLFVLVVSLFAVASDRLDGAENKAVASPSPMAVAGSGMSDEEFLAQMIKHHEEAVAMAEKVLLPTDRREIHELASSIIQTQSKEIETMKQWQKEWYGK